MTETAEIPFKINQLSDRADDALCILHYHSYIRVITWNIFQHSLWFNSIYSFFFVSLEKCSERNVLSTINCYFADGSIDTTFNVILHITSSFFLSLDCRSAECCVAVVMECCMIVHDSR